MMAASQRNQQEAFQELTRASKDKSNDVMFDSIKIFNGRNRQAFKDWIDEVDQILEQKSSRNRQVQYDD